MPSARSLSFLASATLMVACSSGRRWVQEPLRAQSSKDEGVRLMDGTGPGPSKVDETQPPAVSRASINAPPAPPSEDELADAGGKRPSLELKGRKRQVKEGPVDGRLLGVFRNTYYDFPTEEEYGGPETPLMNASCKPIARVPRGFFEAVCVQGSGTLISGATVSFAKRDCRCAEVCPRTNQKICFDALDRDEFPWGRGAQGTAITPLRSIAVDSNVIPLGTRVYILEFDGVQRSPGGARHDGCFVAEDRGMKVVGDHVDIFTGNPRITKHLNGVIPSNEGVHVYLETARCESLRL